MSSSNCCFLTCIQISQEAGQVVWYFYLFQNFPQFVVTHTVKGFGLVKKSESWVPKNWYFWTVALEKTLESPLDYKESQPVNPKGNQSWIFIGRTDAKAETPILWPLDVKELTHWKRPWCWEKLKEAGEGDDRGWDGWMTSLTQWTRVWVSSGSWWWTGRPGMLQSTGSERVRHDWVTELNWTASMQTLIRLQTPCSLWGNIPMFPPSLLPQSPYSHHLAYLKWLFSCCLAGSINWLLLPTWLSFQLWLLW